MTERNADGRFGRQDKKVRGRPFQKGQTRPAGSGRRAGTPNKLTLASREFLAALVDDPAVQEAVRQRIIKGDAVAFFRAVEHVLGRPAERANVNLAGQVDNKIEIRWLGAEHDTTS
jgi:hypothetical protein